MVQLAFSFQALDAAQSAYQRLKRLVLDLRKEAGQAGMPEPGQPLERHIEPFRAAAMDDLNMPQALAAMWTATKDEAASPADRYATLMAMDDVLGLGMAGMQEEALGISEQEIQQLIEDRAAARKGCQGAAVQSPDQVADQIFRASLRGCLQFSNVLLAYDHCCW